MYTCTIVGLVNKVCADMYSQEALDNTLSTLKLDDRCNLVSTALRSTLTMYIVVSLYTHIHTHTHTHTHSHTELRYYSRWQSSLEFCVP